MTTIGILGGGQLAQMICEVAPSLGVKPLLYVAYAKEPAAQVCRHFVLGDWTTTAAIETFLSQCEVVIYENEFIPCHVLEAAAKRVAAEQGHDVSFRPGFGVISQIQNKLTQKQILNRLGIETSAYDACPLTEKFDDASLQQWIGAMLLKYKGACVFKWAKFGYDGKGTWICPGPTALPGHEHEKIKDFCAQGLRQGGAIYVEEKIQFHRELALVASFSETGEFKTYPLVVSEQRSGICRLVTGPAISLGVPQQLEAQAIQAARRLALDLNLVGTFAIEFFQSVQGQLLVNEIAPRVHNSGHFTQDATACSQFENHLRAVLGLPLGATTSAGGFAMLNLIGTEVTGTKKLINYRPPLATSPALKVHWYGKEEIRKGRKMGHINGICDTMGELDSLVKTMENYEHQWVESLKKCP